MIIHDMEQLSDSWFALRVGIPTASESKKLITGGGKESKQLTDYAYQLAGELYAGKPLDAWNGNEYTERGIELEQAARWAYEQSQGHWVEQIGFCTDDNAEYGCSPDGFIEDSGMIEIKCLKASNHVKAHVYYNKHKKIPVDYMPQVQMQLLVTKKKWCDLFFYHPELPLLIIRQEPVKELQEMLVKQIKECIRIRDEAIKIIERRKENKL